MPPRLCLLIESFHPKFGGGETHARLLSATLVRRGLPVFVLTQRQGRSWPRTDEVDGVPVHRVGVPGFKRFGKFLMMPGALLHLLRHRRDYDIIYVCGLRTLGPVAALVSLATGCRLVLRAEARDELAAAEALGKIPSGLTRRIATSMLALRNALMRRADRFLSISQVIREEYLAAGVPAERIASIANGIDVRRFAPATPAERFPLRERLGLPDGVLCTYTGKLNRMKGLEMLLRAWCRLSASYPQLHLVLVGSGANQFLSCEVELRAFVRDKGLERSVTFTGAVANVDAYLKASDLFVFPSETEALPISLIEALASGLAIVASTAGGIPDIVDDGVTGLLIEVGDEAGLVAAIERLVQRPELGAQLGRAARAKAVELFSIEAVADAHERLFRALLDPAAPAPGGLPDDTVEGTAARRAPQPDPGAG
jgi:glycosyltransferase involved in cell wall biosynthesis